MKLKDFEIALDSTGVTARHPSIDPLATPVVLGEPIHNCGDALVERYESAGLAAYLDYEKRHSFGNYILMDVSGDTIRLVTSLGYCGGYLDMNGDGVRAVTRLDRLNESTSPANVNCHRYEQYCETYLTEMPPFQTVFDGVQRLPPAFHVEFSPTGVTTYRSYLPGLSTRRPTTLRAALDECLSSISASRVNLLFSGGLDSTVLYYALKRSPVTEIQLYSVHLGPVTEGPPRANVIADRLGLDVRYLTYGSWPAESLTETITRNLSQDYISPYSPSIPLLTDVEPRGPVLSAQCADEVYSENMNRPRAPDIRYLPHLGYSDRRMSALGDLVENLRKTAPAKSGRKYLEQLIQGTRSYEAHKPTSYVKSVLERSVAPHDVDSAWLTQAVRRFAAAVPPAVCATDTEFYRIFMYYHRCQNNLKLTSSTPMANGRTVTLPFVSGPVLAYFCGRPLSVRDALFPKRAFYEYVKEESGSAYPDLAFRDRDSERSLQRVENDYLAAIPTPLIEELDRLFDPGCSRLVNNVGSQGTLETTYRDIATKISDGSDFTLCQARTAHRILNMELITD